MRVEVRIDLHASCRQGRHWTPSLCTAGSWRFIKDLHHDESLRCTCGNLGYSLFVLTAKPCAQTHGLAALAQAVDSGTPPSSPTVHKQRCLTSTDQTSRCQIAQPNTQSSHHQIRASSTFEIALLRNRSNSPFAIFLEATDRTVSTRPQLKNMRKKTSIDQLTSQTPAPDT